MASERPRQVQVAVRFPPEIVERIDQAAADDDRTRAGMVRLLVERALRGEKT